MRQINQPCDSAIRELAIRLAKMCRSTIGAVLRPEEWSLADTMFYEIIREGLEEMKTGKESG